MARRSRRTELLLEILSKTYQRKDIFLPNATKINELISLKDPKILCQDSFCLKMESPEFIVNPERIKSFKIEDNSSSKSIKIKTYLQIDEWIKDFKKIEISNFET